MKKKLVPKDVETFNKNHQDELGDKKPKEQIKNKVEHGE